MYQEAKIGPAPNISLVYPASCKPEDVLAAQTITLLETGYTWIWLYIGVYNNLVWAYLERT